MKLIRSSSPFKFLCVNIEATFYFEAKEYNMKSLSKFGLIRTGAVVIACLILVNVA
jgi:hypothetical protein